MSNSMIGHPGMRNASGSNINNRTVAGYDVGQLQNYTPEQQQLFNQRIGSLGPDSYLSRLASGDQSLYEEMERPALQQFSGLQGNIASRFSGMGRGATRSSGFQNTQNQAAIDFASQLASTRQNLRQQAIRDLHGMSMDLLNQRPQEQFLIEPQQKKSFWEQLISGAAPAAGAALGFFSGVPGGAGMGYQVGNAFSQGFQ